MSDNKILFPTVILRGITILPGVTAHFDVVNDEGINAVNIAMMGNQQIFLVTKRDFFAENTSLQDLFDVGVIAVIKQLVKLQNGSIRVLVEGKDRAKILDLKSIKNYMASDVELLPQFTTEGIDNEKVDGLVRTIRESFTNYAGVNRKIGKDAVFKVLFEPDPLKLPGIVTSIIPMKYEDKQKILEAENFEDEMSLLADAIIHEINVVKVQEELSMKIKEKIDENQKDYILREQMRAIRTELGDDVDGSEADDFKAEIEKLDADDSVKAKLKKELSRYEHVSSSSSESAVLRAYLETALELPWNHMSPDVIDLKRAEKVLNEDHYGMEKVKERIIEFLAVRALAKSQDSQIICLVGPPGTGKTSIARSIARALQKEYVRISLGGVRDEAEIRGHRKTYVGAMPGRIIEGLRDAHVANPLMLLDEIDKVGSDARGDTSSALLEVLDPDQNSKFRDHYLEIPVDLSKVFFLATANSLSEIKKPLLDRMEIIEVSGYTENEKFHIAKEYLIKRQSEKNGLNKRQCDITDGAIRDIIAYYTKEAGVRTLERKIGEVYRKAAKEILLNDVKGIKVTKTNLKDYLGKRIYRPDRQSTKEEVGIAHGLAWTEVGGDTLSVEVNVLPGSGELALTGNLGDVMKESAMAGLSFIRSIALKYRVPKEFFKENDIHIHIPEGAVPKDGPSAGITMACAMLSAITGQRLRSDVAMTGEITLRGRVLPVGGLKEKTLAAKMNGFKTVLIPAENRPDIEDLSQEITKGLNIIYISSFQDAAKYAFVKE